jgi:ABC-2 type transport system permease protein
MMLRAFKSEWIKMRRRSVLLGGASMALFALIFIPLGIVTATSPGGRSGGGPQALTKIALSGNQGLTTLLSRGGTLTAVIALILVASAMAAEYQQGTLRNLLVRQPARLRLLTGKFLALLTYALIAATVAFLVGIGAALVTAPARGIDTVAWTSSAGIANLFAMYGNLVLAVIAYSVLGFFSAVVFRSPAAAVAAPLAYILIVENLLGAVWSDAPQWLFGKLVAAVLNGQSVLSAGAGLSSYGRGLFLGVVYVAGFVIVAGTLFRGRDVST